MKKSIFTKMGAAAMVLTLVTASLVGGTFAKYTSTVDGTAKATVAKWAIAMKSDNTELNAQNATIALVNKNTEVDTKDNKIAPGSKGDFTLAIDGNGSDIGFTYSIMADDTNLGGVPIKFSLSEDMSNPIAFTGHKATIIAETDVEKENVGTPITKTIYWAWDANDTGDNAADTAAGVAATANGGTVTFTMTATQLTKQPAS